MTKEALKLALELKNSASAYWTEKEISIIEKLIDALAQPEQSATDIAALIQGMEVSIDVSTGDHDAGHRLFGTVTLVQENQGGKHGLILLVQDPEPNFKAQPEQEPVAWMTLNEYGEEDDIHYENPEGHLLEGWTYKPLYTHPPTVPPEKEPLEYWNAVEGWVKIDEVREHFGSVGCGTIYKTAGEDRVPLYTNPEPHNFCPRCGKRAQGVLGQPQVHTCTPPLWGYK